MQRTASNKEIIHPETVVKHSMMLLCYLRNLACFCMNFRKYFIMSRQWIISQEKG